jgi:hypothetical protein
VLHGLGEHRQEEHRRERDHRRQHAQDQGKRGLTVAEQGEIDGGLVSAQGPDGVSGEQYQTAAQRQQHRAAAPAGDGGPAGTVQREGEPEGQHAEPDGVGPSLRVAGRGRGGGNAPYTEQTGQPDRKVDQEDPSPAAGGDEQPAQGRAERRGKEEQQSGGDRDPAAGALFGQQQAHRQRDQRGADQALEGAGGDEHGHVGRGGAGRGGDDEPDQTHRVHPQRAEPAGQERRGRQSRGERE